SSVNRAAPAVRRGHRGSPTPGRPSSDCRATAIPPRARYRRRRRAPPPSSAGWARRARKPAGASPSGRGWPARPSGRATRRAAPPARLLVLASLGHRQRHLPLAALLDVAELLLVAVRLRVVDRGLVALDGDFIDLALGDLVVFAVEPLRLQESRPFQLGEFVG